MQLTSLRDVLQEQLEDLLDAEQQLVKALPKLAQAVSTDELRQALEHHLEETHGHVQRCQDALGELGVSSPSTRCKGMAGLIAEGEEVIGMDGDPMAKDAAIIGASQRVEHYEIAGYGTARTLADEIGMDDVRDLMDQTLDEESQADKLLTKIATGGVMGPFLEEGDVLGHEAMGVVEEVGAEVTAVAPGDRVVVPFNVSCGTCFMCSRGLHSQCETTQVREYGKGAALFGYTKLYGEVPGGQAEALRVPFGNTLPIKVPEGPPDDRFVFLSDVLPTAWQAVEYADVPDGGTVVVLGLGPIGEMCTRIAQHRGHRVIGVDLVPDRLERARSHGVEALDLLEHEDDLAEVVRGMTDGRGPDSVIDAVGMEAHGAPLAKLVQAAASFLPDPVQARLMQTAGVDRLSALTTAIELVRRGGTISLSGVYGGMADPLPMQTLFDKQIQLRMGQANVLRWVPELLPLLLDGDPLGVDDFASHHVPLEDAPAAYERFQKKEDGTFKVLVRP